MNFDSTIRNLVILGAGTSVEQMAGKGLWKALESSREILDIWSLNFIYRNIPFLPDAEVFIDCHTFLAHFKKDILNLAEKGVEIICAKHPLAQNTGFTVYNGSYEYHGRNGIEKNLIYMGGKNTEFVGIFSLAAAIARRYEDIYLFGYDCGSITEGSRKTHAFDIQPKDKLFRNISRPEIYENGIPDFAPFLDEEDVRIWNVSPSSNLDYFPKITYSSFLEKIGTAGGNHPKAKRQH